MFKFRGKKKESRITEQPESQHLIKEPHEKKPIELTLTINVLKLNEEYRLLNTIIPITKKPTILDTVINKIKKKELNKHISQIKKKDFDKLINNLTQHNLTNLTNIVINNLYKNIGNDHLIVIEDLIPSPFTDSYLTLNELKKLLMEGTPLVIRFLQFICNDDDDILNPINIFMPIPNKITKELIEIISHTLHNYIYNNFSRRIHLTNLELIPINPKGEVQDRKAISPDNIKTSITNNVPIPVYFSIFEREKTQIEAKRLNDTELANKIKELNTLIDDEKRKKVYQKDLQYNIEGSIESIDNKKSIYEKEAEYRKGKNEFNKKFKKKIQDSFIDQSLDSLNVQYNNLEDNLKDTILQSQHNHHLDLYKDILWKNLTLDLYTEEINKRIESDDSSL